MKMIVMNCLFRRLHHYLLLAHDKNETGRKYWLFTHRIELYYQVSYEHFYLICFLLMLVYPTFNRIQCSSWNIVRWLIEWDEITQLTSLLLYVDSRQRLSVDWRKVLDKNCSNEKRRWLLNILQSIRAKVF